MLNNFRELSSLVEKRPSSKSKTNTLCVENQKIWSTSHAGNQLKKATFSRMKSPTDKLKTQFSGMKMTRRRSKKLKDGNASVNKHTYQFE